MIVPGGESAAERTVEIENAEEFQTGWSWYFAAFPLLGTAAGRRDCFAEWGAAAVALKRTGWSQDSVASHLIEKRGLKLSLNSVKKRSHIAEVWLE